MKFPEIFNVKFNETDLNSIVLNGSNVWRKTPGPSVPIKENLKIGYVDPDFDPTRFAYGMNPKSRLNQDLLHLLCPPIVILGEDGYYHPNEKYFSGFEFEQGSDGGYYAFRFVSRDNLFWNDGSPMFPSEDVKKCIETYANPIYWQNVAENKMGYHINGYESYIDGSSEEIEGIVADGPFLDIRMSEGEKLVLTRDDPLSTLADVHLMSSYMSEALLEGNLSNIYRWAMQTVRFLSSSPYVLTGFEEVEQIRDFHDLISLECRQWDMGGVWSETVWATNTVTILNYSKYTEVLNDRYINSDLDVIHNIEFPPFTNIGYLGALPDSILSIYPSDECWFLIPRLGNYADGRSSYFEQRDVRAGIFCSMDSDSISQGLFESGERMNSLYSIGQPISLKTDTHNTSSFYNPDLARSLAEPYWDNGDSKVLKIFAENDQLFIDFASVLQSYLADCGFTFWVDTILSDEELDLVIKQQDFELLVYKQKFERNKIPFKHGVFNWYEHEAELPSGIYPGGFSNQLSGMVNFFLNPEIEEAVNILQLSQNQIQYEQSYKNFQNLWFPEFFYIPLFNTSRTTASRIESWLPNTFTEAADLILQNYKK